MAYLQEIRIVQAGQEPAVGSTQDPNIIWIVPITDKICDMYTSDNNGIVRATSVQTPLYDSVQEANENILPANRFEGKTVLIRTIYIFNEGQPEEEEVEVFNEYWYQDGIADGDLVLKGNSLAAVLENNNKIPLGQVIQFIPESDANLPEELQNSIENIKISTGPIGQDIVFSDFDVQGAGDAVFNMNVILGVGNLMEFNPTKPLFGTIIVGAAALNKAGGGATSASIAIGGQALQDFEGLNEDATYYNFGGGWGRVASNIAIGYWAGRGMKEGSGNIYIGNSTASRPSTESNKLVIHSAKGPGDGSNDPTNLSFFPLIFADFDERWFLLSGKFRYNRNANPVVTDYSDEDYFIVMDTDGEFHPVDKHDFISDLLEEKRKSYKINLELDISVDTPVTGGYIKEITFDGSTPYDNPDLTEVISWELLQSAAPNHFSDIKMMMMMEGFIPHTLQYSGGKLHIVYGVTTGSAKNFNDMTLTLTLK